MKKIWIELIKKRNKNIKLTIELIPQTCWYKNVRSEITYAEWGVIKNTCSNRAGHKCEICGASGKTQGYSWNVECHEIWDYNDEEGIQKLNGFIALCPRCHKVKHIGLAKKNGEYDMCIKHLKKTNKWKNKRVDTYLKEIQETFMMRSQYDWELDISLIKTYGDELAELMNRFKKK